MEAWSGKCTGSLVGWSRAEQPVGKGVVTLAALSLHRELVGEPVDRPVHELLASTSRTCTVPVMSWKVFVRMKAGSGGCPRSSSSPRCFDGSCADRRR